MRNVFNRASESRFALALKYAFPHLIRNILSCNGNKPLETKINNIFEKLEKILLISKVPFAWRIARPLNPKLWKTTDSNVISLLHRISENYLISLGKLAVWPANFTVDQYISLINQWVSLVESGKFHWFLCGRLITFTTVVSNSESVSFYWFRFREHIGSPFFP